MSDPMNCGSTNAGSTEIQAEIGRAAAARAAQMAKAVHDLRNLVSATEVVIETLMLDIEEQERVAPTTIEQTRSTIAATIAAQFAFLEDLHALALIEAHALPLHPELVSIAGLISTMQQMITAKFVAAGCVLVVDLPETPSLVWCDPRRITRVLYHILMNALKYTVGYRVNGGMVRISAVQQEQLFVCQIEDNGRGFAPHDLAQLDQPFLHLGVGASVSAGSGIGLNLAHGVLCLSGGRLDIFSAGLGRGTTVSISLPLAATAG